MIYFKKPIKCIKPQQSGLLLCTLSTEKLLIMQYYAFYDSVKLWVNTLKSATWTNMFLPHTMFLGGKHEQKNCQSF